MRQERRTAARVVVGCFGVGVWTMSRSAGHRAFRFRNASLAVFLGKLNQSLSLWKKWRSLLAGRLCDGDTLDRHFGVWQVDAKTGKILGQTERRSSVSRFMLDASSLVVLGSRRKNSRGHLCGACVLSAAGGRGVVVDIAWAGPKIVGDIHSDLGLFGLLPLLLLTGTGVLLSAAL